MESRDMLQDNSRRDRPRQVFKYIEFDHFFNYPVTSQQLLFLIV